MILLNRLAGTLADWSEEVLCYSEKLEFKKLIRQYKNYDDFAEAIATLLDYSDLTSGYTLNSILRLYDLPKEKTLFKTNHYCLSTIELEYNPAKLTLKQRKNVLKRLRDMVNAISLICDKL